jgi:hypothetical protein
MKAGRIAAGALAALVFSPAAHAGFQFNYTVTPGTGALAGDNIFRFYAKNDQTGDQAGSKSLLASDIHFKTQSQPLVFDFRDANNDSRIDANVSGRGMDENNITGTFMRFGDYADWQAVYVRPVGNDGSSTNNAQTAYASVTDFNMVGFSLNKALDATQGLGRFYGAAVAPAGMDVTVVGQVAAEKGNATGTGAAPLDLAEFLAAESTTSLFSAESAAAVEQGPFYQFSFTATAPEPGALCLLALPALTLLRRRRRRQV